LVAQVFDERRLEPAGEAVAIAEHLMTNLSRAAFSTSANGILAYRSGAAAGAQFAWVDRQGRDLGLAGAPGNYWNLAISPDGGRVAHTERAQEALRHVWVLDLARGANTRLSFAPEGCESPAWSPDG